jgi:hypothetical protein
MFFADVVHETQSGFRGCSFGANEHGIFLAVGPDRMHLMLEGLGKHIVAYCIQKITKAGRLQAVDGHIALMPLTLHQGSTKTIPFLTKLTGGLESVNMVSALHLPGLLVILSLALVRLLVVNFVQLCHNL